MSTVEHLVPGSALDIGRSIVYEDGDLLIVNKPSGLLTVDDDRGSPNLFSLLKRRARRGKILIVHRLDRDTSGLLFFAKSFRVLKALQQCFEEWAVERSYEAVVSGALFPGQTLKVTLDLFEDRFGTVRVVDRGRGKTSITYVKCLSAGPARSYVDISLLTGRKNQIRCTMSYIGHPILGDRKYGGGGEARMLLNAYRLSFPSELGLKRNTFEIPRIWAKGFNVQ